MWGNDDAVNRAKEWNFHPPKAFEDSRTVLLPISRAIDLIGDIETSKWAEKITETGDIPIDPDYEKKYSQWFRSRASVSTSRLALPNESPNSPNEMDFELLISITESRVHLKLHRTILEACGRDLWASPFEDDLRELLCATARQCCDFRGVLQTAQDVYGGFPFHLHHMDRVIAYLRGLSSPDAIDVWDYSGLIIHRSCLLREVIRIGRWIELKCPELQSDANNISQQLKELYEEHKHKLTKTVVGKVIRESELTIEARPSSEWRVILGYASNPKTQIGKTTFYDAIHGKGKRPLDAVPAPGQKYRLRIDQLPDGTKSEPLRNKIIQESKSGEGSRLHN